MSDRIAAAVAELADAIRAELADELASRADGADALLSVREAAATLAIGRSSVYGEIQAGRLRSVKVGRRRLVPSAAIRAYVAERP